MSVSLYCTLRKWGGVSQKLRTKGKGSLHAANPANKGAPPMRILGSAIIPVVWAPDDRVHNIAVRVVDELPYGLIIGARFLRTNNSVLDVGAGRGFKQTPSSRWIPFIERSMSPVIAPLAWNRFCALINTPNDAEVKNSPFANPTTRLSGLMVTHLSRQYRVGGRQHPTMGRAACYRPTRQRCTTSTRFCQYSSGRLRYKPSTTRSSTRNHPPPGEIRHGPRSDSWHSSRHSVVGTRLTNLLQTSQPG